MHNTYKKMVVIGGGTGLAVLLKGIKKYPYNISAIVTMTDSGFSTGRLRKEFGILPPGDIRKSLIALAKEENQLTELFNYRFHQGRGLSGHSLGNLLLLALTKIYGNFSKAIYHASKLLATKGIVLPSTLEKVDLVSTHMSGKKIKGEHQAALRGRIDPITKLELNNKTALANPEAIKAIYDADVIIIGPGSLWTSIIPNFLLHEITKSVVNNHQAKKIFICNISTERGETQKYSVADHINMITKNVGSQIFDYVLVNNKIIKTTKKSYKLGEVNNITTSAQQIGPFKIISTDLIDKNNPLFHDSDKLADSIWRLGNGK
jgi:uncharacterized cofD-like protein